MTMDAGWRSSRLAVGALLLGLVVCGCSGKTDTGGEDGDDGGDEGGDEGGDAGGDPGGEGGGEDLDDPRGVAGADPGCEDFEGTAIAGATGFFFGQYVATADPTVWEGEEQWLLFANERWQELGEDDCTITWNTEAVWTEAAGTCGTCEYGLTVAATIDLARTSCPEGLYEGDESFSVVYGVDVAGDVATYSFAASGTLVGSGHAVEGGSNFLSSGSCLYF